MFSLQPNEMQSMVRDSARQFATRVLSVEAPKLDREGGFPTKSLKEAADLGLLGVNVPEAYGGVEAGAVAYSLAVTELAKACAATTVALCVSNMVAEVVVAFGNDEQRKEHVPKLCSGEYVVGGFALSESGAGSDPGGMTTKARKTDKGWVLTDPSSGSPVVRTLDSLWCGPVPTISQAPRGSVVFWYPETLQEWSEESRKTKWVSVGSPTTPLDFNGVELGPEALLGEEGKGFPIAMMALDGGRVGIGSLALGVGQAAAEVANGYACERKQFGRAIAKFQAIQWMMADSATEMEAAELLVRRAAWLKEQGKSFTKEASIAKLYASEKAFGVCNRAIQMLGGYGYTREYPVERYLRDVRVTSIYEGTSEVQRLVISRDIIRRFSS